MASIRHDHHAETHEPSDRQLRSTIVSRLRENPYTQDGHIRVTVHHGDVRLSGRVPSTMARRVAEEDVGNLPGVANVELELDIAA